MKHFHVRSRPNSGPPRLGQIPQAAFGKQILQWNRTILHGFNARVQTQGAHGFIMGVPMQTKVRIIRKINRRDRPVGHAHTNDIGNIRPIHRSIKKMALKPCLRHGKFQCTANPYVGPLLWAASSHVVVSNNPQHFVAPAVGHLPCHVQRIFQRPIA